MSQSGANEARAMPVTVPVGGAHPRVDLNRATNDTPEVPAIIDDMFKYHPWSADQTTAGTFVRRALVDACLVIVAHVPPSPDRAVAIRKLREARMDCNSAITHGGKY